MRPSRWLILVSIAALVGFIGYQLQQSLQSQREREVDSAGALIDMLPQAVQMIQNFHRVEVRDGQKVWEVEAEEAQYVEENDEVLVREPRASFFSEDGSEVMVRGGKGRVRLVDRELKRIQLQDNVEIHVREFIIRVDDADYRRDLDRITTKGPVHITGETVELEGRGMSVDVEQSSFTLESDVRVTLRSPSSEDAPAS